MILKDHLPPSILELYFREKYIKKRERKRKLSLETVRWTLQKAKGNKTEAARKLGVSRATLYRFLDSMKTSEKNRNL
ncbi:hypothetical protein AMJ44_10660 [candidate division WOR-1 bacterium DG_54_3]|uniref:DNA binding HTH domain-containing protein n=1 Tax=candidate division WOR-1 bacterium DG_54_3 TaxID=1703775 RepID=A0A0S7XRX5_UNCSA|nr:MAG: hypothetical protein AMJ44_10660 [candidate division WOR-1 bacterium DG_54_3]